MKIYTLAFTGYGWFYFGMVFGWFVRGLGVSLLSFDLIRPQAGFLVIIQYL